MREILYLEVPTPDIETVVAGYKQILNLEMEKKCLLRKAFASKYPVLRHLLGRLFPKTCL